MKFILREDKFLLKETPSFILEERFILDEEVLLEAQATLKQLVIDLNKLDTLLPDLQTALDIGLNIKILDGTPLADEKLDVDEQIKAACTEVKDLISGKKDFKALIDKIRAKANLPENSFSEEEVKILQPLCYSVASDGISVKDRLKGIKSHKGDIAEQAASLQERLPKLKANIEELYKFFEKETPKEPEEPKKPIKYSLDPEKLELKPGEKTKVKLMADPKPEEPVKATFVSSNEKIVTINNTGEVTAVAEGEAQIKVTVAAEKVDLICKVTVAAAEEKPEEDEPSEDEVVEALDWADLYNLCGNSENKEEAFKCFWQGGLPTNEDEAKKRRVPLAATDIAALGYFKGEWGDKAKLVESFGTAFTDTLKEIGWGEVLNPFVAWLRYLFKFSDLAFSGDSFETILEAYKKDDVEEEDLRGKGKLEKLNLVLNPTLYTKSSDEILEYLTWQKDAIRAESKIPSDTNLQTMYANIVYAKGSDKLKDGSTLELLNSKGTRYEIRPLTKYKELIKINLKVDGNKSTKVQATDEEVAAIIKKITDKSTAKKFLAYIVNYYRVAKLSSLEALLKEPFGDKLKSNRNDTETTFDEDKYFDKLLQTTSKKYSTEQLKALVSGLLKIAGLE